MPFLATTLYTGPMVEHLGGVDISWIIGLLVPAVLYYLVARRKATRQAPARMILPADPGAFERPRTGPETNFQGGAAAFNPMKRRRRTALPSPPNRTRSLR